jgi:type II secretory ATPase GspE/PulE/Tfp pilus assembly ATPase PilB-like protein
MDPPRRPVLIPVATPRRSSRLPTGRRLELDKVLLPLIEDGLIVVADAARAKAAQREARSAAEVHPLVLIANLKLPNPQRPGAELTLERLTEWLAAEVALPYLRIVDWLWQYAFDQRASDIHLEPRREMGVIRFRIDGVLHKVYQVPVIGVMAAVTAASSCWAHGRGGEAPPAGRPHQDPRAGRRRGRDAPVHLPTAFGEKMVMRIFDPDTARQDDRRAGLQPTRPSAGTQLIASARTASCW